MRKSMLSTAITATLAIALSACAPKHTGTDQCSDVNVNLLEITDQKFTQLQQSGLSANTVGQIDQTVLNMMHSANAPIAGCAIGITRADELVFLKAYGEADVNTQRPFTIATPSAVGSISKTLTALAALKLVQDTPLQLNTAAYATLNTPVLQPQFGDPTLEQLLRHQAGFKSFPTWNAAEFNDLASINGKYNPQGIEWPSLQPLLVFPGYGQVAANRPGPQVNPVYSNNGYNIAGAIIDKHSQSQPVGRRGYENYVWQQVARGSAASGPSMTSACLNTSFRQNDIKNLARGYSTNGAPMDFSATSDGWGWEGPAGGWSMTIGDLARLMLILQSDAVIPKAVIDGTMRKYSGTWDGLHLAMGLERSEAPSGGLGNTGSTGDMWFGKGGNIRGFTADMKIWPNTPGGSWGVAFMCNREKVNPRLTADIREILLSNSVSPGVGSGIGVGSSNSPPQPDWLQTAIRFEPLVRRFAASYLDGAASGERAWASARRELLGLGNGQLLVRALESGDFANAVRTLPTLRWPDGSPVTP